MSESSSVRSAGSHQLGDGLGSDRQGEIAGLTGEQKGVSVDTQRGQEAEDLVRDIIFISERLIHLIVEGGKSGWQDQED